MSRLRRLWPLPVLATFSLALSSCTSPRADGVIDVSIIGSGPMRLADPDRVPLSPPQAVLASATAAGLVALDANGQVEPALAESWIATTDGLSIIFRIRQTSWPDGTEVTGDQVARALDAATGPDSRNPLKPLLTAVDAIVGMTGRVLEIRLKAPRPNLLQLLAQPELGIRRNGTGTGPFRVVRLRENSVRLRTATPPDDPDQLAPDEVELSRERAALAIARFAADKSDLVMGGTLADFPILRAATIRPGRLHFDPVQGLFGLAITGRGTFLASADVRQALAMALDRTAIASAMGIPGWTITDTALPAQLDSARLPAQPDWSTLSLVQRRADAAQRIARWRGGNPALSPLRVALPPGPGMRILFARLAADWRAIGVQAIAVPLHSPDADLRLIDAVAPNTSANWYLTRLSCEAGLVCDARGDRALAASRSATTLDARSAAIADADSALTARGSFIAIAVPIRWSLVDPGLTGWKENIFAAHPLAELRPPSSAGG